MCWETDFDPKIAAACPTVSATGIYACCRISAVRVDFFLFPGHRFSVGARQYAQATVIPQLNSGNETFAA